MHKTEISVFWFRRDLRLDDNHGLYRALQGPHPVLPVFIFDTEITDELQRTDPRIEFIYKNLRSIHTALNENDGSIYCLQGRPLDVWKRLIRGFQVRAVYSNEDYEPYAIDRDRKIGEMLESHGIPFHQYKDQVIFARGDVMKADQTPYTVYTPYKKRWLEKLTPEQMKEYPSLNQGNYFKVRFPFPELEQLGFEPSGLKVHQPRLENLDAYHNVRDFPAMDGTSYLGPHLRFGTVGIRQILAKVRSNEAFVSELIWREFFMQILYHFPRVVDNNFKSKYDHIEWRNDAVEFECWKSGLTGYPIVDAGMRELNATGYMHNRVRMITGSFLCKHLLIDWRWGEAYFAEKLLDYELASNNGNWQWVAGTGCDAAPYFRIFNPEQQQKKFDPDLHYVKKWVPEMDSPKYRKPIIDHRFARERALGVYKEAIRISKTGQ